MNKKSIEKLDFNNPHSTGLVCAYLSTIAYQDKTRQYNWLVNKFDFVEFVAEDTADINFYHAKDDENRVMYIVVCGTHSENPALRWKNLLVSLKFNLIKVDGYKIHKGYYHCGMGILKKLYFPVKEAFDDGYKIVFTGHSLGGVISKYVAVQCDIECRVYTFGAPQLATSTFFDTENDVVIYDYVIHGDLIPSFPSTIMGHSDYFEIHDDNIKRRARRRIHWFFSLLYLIEMKLVISSLRHNKCHSMKNYVLRMKRYFKGR